MTREHCDFNPSRGRVIDCLGTSSSPSGRCGDRSQDLIFSETEKEEARPVTQQIFAQNIGQIGNVYDEAKVINTQTAFAQYDSKQIAALVEQIEKTIEFLPSDQKEPVHGHIQEIKAEIVKPDIQQDRPKITRALHSIKCVCGVCA